MYHFNRRTAGPLGPSPAPGCDKPVIPSVPFIRCAIARPHGATGSLRPTFVAARPVGLAVRLPSAVTLQSASTDRAEGTLRAPPLLFRRRPPQSNCPPATVPDWVCQDW